MSKPSSPISTTSNLAESDSHDLKQLTGVIRTLAEQREGDCLALLALLRQLNDLHYEIRETLFRDALPDNRQRLYRLLKDIEQEGGWPYIPRMKLLALLENMELAESAESNSDEL
ncbi:MAG: hypothetical protein AB8B99_19405 [Phormidesmis sp.]